jgi:hypothetical protein
MAEDAASHNGWADNSAGAGEGYVSYRAAVLIVTIPALILAAGAFLRSVPGEWSQNALLAWGAVSLGLLAGQATDTLYLAAIGLVLGFVALAVGGAVGLGVLAAVYAGAAAAALAGALAMPWPVAAVLAAACAAGAARGVIH